MTTGFNGAQWLLLTCTDLHRPAPSSTELCARVGAARHADSGRHRERERAFDAAFEPSSRSPLHRGQQRVRYRAFAQHASKALAHITLHLQQQMRRHFRIGQGPVGPPGAGQRVQLGECAEAVVVGLRIEPS